MNVFFFRDAAKTDSVPATELKTHFISVTETQAANIQFPIYLFNNGSETSQS